MLQASLLAFEYPEKSVLQDVNFTVSAGEILHVRGRNGSGKTTLLKLLSGLLQPTSGFIYYNAQCITAIRYIYQQNLCFIGHKAGINPFLTTRENCYFDLHYVDNCQLEKLLLRFSLERVADIQCGLLSAGQQRRVGLLRLLMSRARLWILDEPLTALDKNVIDSLMHCFGEHLQSGGQIILSSHQNLPEVFNNYQEYAL